MGKIQICNVAQDEFRLERMSYNFAATLPGCVPPTPYTSVWIGDMYDVEVVHIGGSWTSQNDIKRIPILIPAKEIVADFFRSEQLLDKGCFIPAGEVPTEQEISAAHATRNAWLMRLVEEGEKLYGQHGAAGIPMIPDYFKRAAKELNLSPSWVVTMGKRMTECPACFDQVRPEAAICKSCGAILDAEKAKKYGLIEEKRGPGRPPKEREEVAA